MSLAPESPRGQEPEGTVRAAAGLAALEGDAESLVVAALSPSERDRVFIVIAAYNEATQIGAVVAALREAFEHVIVVDDGSGDATGEEARAAGAALLTHAINRGQGAALQTGISYSLEHGAKVVVTFDADRATFDGGPARADPPILDGQAHFCLGSRFLGTSDGVPWTRRLILRAAVWFTRFMSRMHLTDAHNGLRAFSRTAAVAIDIQLDRMAHASELLDQIHASGLPFREVPVHIRYTDYSLAKGQRSTAALRVAFDYLIGKLLR